MAAVTMRDMLEAGVHFGHQTRFWNPKMAPFIFGDRNRIHIINLEKSLPLYLDAVNFCGRMAANNGTVLFVGTKRSAQDAVREAAQRCGMPYVNRRWLGGMLTNFVTMRSRIDRMEELEARVDDGTMATLPKKEQALLTKELEKLQRNLGGVRTMTALPQALFVVDTKREEIAIKEANRLHIPVIGLLDTNSDPDVVEYGIPANDDAIRSVALMCELAADAILSGGGKAQISVEEMSEAPAPAEAEAPSPEAEAPAEAPVSE